FAKDEDTLSNQLQASLAEEVSIQMLPIKRKAETLLTSIDSVLIMVQYVFNENTRMNLSKSFENIKIAIDNLKNTTFNIDTLVSTQRNRLSHIIGNVESISSNIEKNNEKITTILSNFSIISDSLAKSNIKQTIENANKAISNVSNVFDKINNGKGTLGLLVNNDTLYNQINNAASSLDKLLIDIKSNPSRYIKISVFGKNQEK
ncbi:MAG: MCE family protein, partial [Bacteroidales bacterium]